MKQKVWFVTGASKGFGPEIVKAVLASGDKVIATVRNNAAALQDDLGDLENLLVVTMDVVNEAAVKQDLANGISRFGTLDVSGIGNCGIPCS